MKMEEQVISFETAKLAKAKGFNEENGHTAYSEDGLKCISTKSSFYDEVKYPIQDSTQSLLQKWLRDKNNLHVFIGYRMDIKKWDSHTFNLNITAKEYIKDRTLFKFHLSTVYDSYEEALEAGLKEALELIG